MLIASFDQIHFCMIMLHVPHLPNASSYHKVFTCFICVYLFFSPLHFGVGNHSVTHGRQRGPGWAATLRGCTCEHVCKHLQVWRLSKRMWAQGSATALLWALGGFQQLGPCEIRWEEEKDPFGEMPGFGDHPKHLQGICLLNLCSACKNCSGHSWAQSLVSASILPNEYIELMREEGAEKN